MGLFDNLGGVVGNVERYVETQWQQRMVQVSVYAGLLFYLLSTGTLIETVEKTVTGLVGLKLGKDGTRALHGVIFAVFMYYGTRYILDPIVKRIHLRQVGGAEGLKNKKQVAKKPVQRKQQKPVQRKK